MGSIYKLQKKKSKLWFVLNINRRETRILWPNMWQVVEEKKSV